MSVESELKRFERLRDEGLLTPEEYEQRRTDLLAAPVIVQPVPASLPRRTRPWLLVAGGVVLGMVLLLVVGAAIDMSSSSSSNTTTSDQAQSTDNSTGAATPDTTENVASTPLPASQCIAISDQQWTTNSYAGAIEGTATNNCGRALKIVTLEFNLYDASGAVIGNATDVVQNLAASDTWHFRASALGTENVAKYALKSIESYDP